MNQVAVVVITKHGSDEAVFLNGECVLTADPGCGDPLEPIRHVAHSLASIHKVEIEEIEFSPNENWQWSEVESELKKNGNLVGGSTTYPITHTYLNEKAEIKKRTLKFDALGEIDAIQLLVNHYMKLDNEYLLSCNLDNDYSGYAILPESRYNVEQGTPDFALNPAVDSCWVSVGNVGVNIKRTDEGVIVNLFDKDCEDAISSAFGCFADYAAPTNSEEIV